MMRRMNVVDAKTTEGFTSTWTEAPLIESQAMYFSSETPASNAYNLAALTVSGTK